MMSTDRSSGRRGVVWAIVGGVVVIAGAAAILIGSALAGGTPNSTPSPTSSNSGATSSPRPSLSGGTAVDASVTEKGWVPEPITTDPHTYIHAALAAAATFDTQKSTRDEWLTYLDTWFTPDTRYATDEDRAEDMQAAQVEMRQGVVLPETEWDSLAGEKGRVVGAVTSDIKWVPIPNDESGDMRIGTADVTLTYTRADPQGAETSYDEQVRVSTQVLCGPASAPTPDSAQQAGDCKLVRYFTQALEP